MGSTHQREKKEMLRTRVETISVPWIKTWFSFSWCKTLGGGGENKIRIRQSFILFVEKDVCPHCAVRFTEKVPLTLKLFKFSLLSLDSEWAQQSVMFLHAALTVIMKNKLNQGSIIFPLKKGRQDKVSDKLFHVVHWGCDIINHSSFFQCYCKKKSNYSCFVEQPVLRTNCRNFRFAKTSRTTNNQTEHIFSERQL